MENRDPRLEPRCLHVRVKVDEVMAREQSLVTNELRRQRVDVDFEAFLAELIAQDQALAIQPTFGIVGRATEPQQNLFDGRWPRIARLRGQNIIVCGNGSETHELRGAARKRRTDEFARTGDLCGVGTMNKVRADRNPVGRFQRLRVLEAEAFRFFVEKRLWDLAGQARAVARIAANAATVLERF